jgi:hypothetical protein
MHGQDGYPFLSTRGGGYKARNRMAVVFLKERQMTSVNFIRREKIHSKEKKDPRGNSPTTQKKRTA